MILRLIDSLNEIIGKSLSTLAIVFAGIIIFDVFMRYVFHQPVRWAFDISKQLFGFYFIMLGAYALKHKTHVRVDLLIQHFNPRVRQLTEILGYLIFFFPFTWVFLTKSYDFAMRSWMQGEMAMVVAATLLLLQGIVEFIRLCTYNPHASLERN